MEVWWLEQSTTQVPDSNDWLGPGERVRLGVMRFPKRRADWRLGRWTAKQAAAGCLKTPRDPDMLARIEIRAAASGAPEVFLDNEPAEISLSISHRDEIAVCAVTSLGLIGCDIELIEPRSDAFLADYFTTDEQAIMARQSAPHRVVTSTLFWSAKESVLKALKVGLRCDLRCVNVRLGESLESFINTTEDTPCALGVYDLGDWHSLTARNTDGQSFAGWWRCTGGLVRTIVTVPSTAAPTIMEWGCPIVGSGVV